LKPDRFVARLRRRNDAALSFVDAASPSDRLLMLDTCVNIDILERRLPGAARRAVETHRTVHLSVVIGELAHVFGRLDPRHPSTADCLRRLGALLEAVLSERPDDSITAGVLLEAGILSGLVFRLGGFQAGQEAAALNDATLFLHALERGYVVLTRNIRDFDLMQQILPAGRVPFYRAT
jgi:predicted nucleic acid-binding protein